MVKDMVLMEEAKPVKVENPASIVARKRAEDERMVRGTFVYRAKPGGRYKTTLRKYKRSQDNRNVQGFIPIDMVDGKEYTVPYWIAEWLNGEAELSCADLRHDSFNINLDTETKPEPKRVPVFRFVIQDYVQC